MLPNMYSKSESMHLSVKNNTEIRIKYNTSKVKPIYYVRREIYTVESNSDYVASILPCKILEYVQQTPSGRIVTIERMIFSRNVQTYTIWFMQIGSLSL